MNLSICENQVASDFASDSARACGAPQRRLRWSRLNGILAAFAAFSGTADASGQVSAPKRMISERMCTGCRITTDTVASIPREGISDQLFVAANLEGTIVGIDPVLYPGRVLRFGPNGRVAADADVSHLFSPGIPFFNSAGQVLVPDERHGMVQILTPTLEPVHTFLTVENLQVGIVLPQGAMVVNALSSTPARVRYALHLVTPGDQRVMSMDRSNIRLLTQANNYEQKRYLAPRDTTSFWSAHAAKYQVDLWDTSGRLIESLQRDAPWFERREKRSLARLEPPPTELTGLVSDSEGLLWLLFSVSDPAWVGYEVDERGHELLSQGVYPGRNRHLEDGVFDTVLEVVDPAQGVVIMHAQYDELLFWIRWTGSGRPL